MAQFTIEELVIPATLSDERGADFSQMIELEHVVETAIYGADVFAHDPAVEISSYNDEFLKWRVFLARVDGLIVGRGFFRAEADEDNDSAWGHVAVLDDFRRLGIGRALADHVEAAAREAGMAKLLSYMAYVEASGPSIVSPTGFGAVPEGRETAFLATRGYTFEQVERLSRLPLPVVSIDEVVDAAARASGSDYVVHSWAGQTPERWREDIAHLQTRMSTDAPSAGLEEPEVVYTVERVIADDERVAATTTTSLISVVEHVPSGKLAGFTDLRVPAELDGNVDQYATLVLREHRGHRLGMLLKVANLRNLQREKPGHPFVNTFNAEENRFMLSVNEAVGFVAIGYEACWRLNL